MVLSDCAIGSMAAESFYFFFQQYEYFGDQIAVSDGVIQADAHGRQQPAVFRPVFSPVYDGSEIQVAVRQLNIQRIVGQPGDEGTSNQLG